MKPLHYFVFLIHTRAHFQVGDFVDEFLRRIWRPVLNADLLRGHVL